MACKDVLAALAEFGKCVETDEGSRVLTHCLYPSFDPVHVFVVRYGEGFRVHDGGGAGRSCWIHGRDEAVISRSLNREAAHFGLSVIEGSIVGEAATSDWLPAAILSVANASACAAKGAIERMAAATEKSLAERIYTVLTRSFPSLSVNREATVVGQSGKAHHFDFVVSDKAGHRLLIDAVAPHPISIAAKYVAFADVSRDNGRGTSRFAVHDRPLEPGDISLLQQVADIVPMESLEPGARRVLLQ